jgi:hypothetical protein
MDAAEMNIINELEEQFGNWTIPLLLVITNTSTKIVLNDPEAN